MKRRAGWARAGVLVIALGVALCISLPTQTEVVG